MSYMANLVGHPFNFDSPKELEAEMNKYFATEKQENWTITGLALALNCDRDTLLNYEKHGQRRIERGVDPEIVRLIKRAKLMVHNAYEQDLRKKGRSGDIFALKNFGWTDQQQIDHTTQGEKLTGFNYIRPDDSNDKADDQAG